MCNDGWIELKEVKKENAELKEKLKKARNYLGCYYQNNSLCAEDAEKHFDKIMEELR